MLEKFEERAQLLQKELQLTQEVVQNLSVQLEQAKIRYRQLSGNMSECRYQLELLKAETKKNELMEQELNKDESNG